jgi:hypothetical protein
MHPATHGPLRIRPMAKRDPRRATAGTQSARCSDVLSILGPLPVPSSGGQWLRVKQELTTVQFLLYAQRRVPAVATGFQCAGRAAGVKQKPTIPRISP